jgi:hypothetical protein
MNEDCNWYGRYRLVALKGDATALDNGEEQRSFWLANAEYQCDQFLDRGCPVF